MNSLTLPYVELIELQLQQHLSRYRRHFQLGDLGASLAIAAPEDDLDLVLSAIWRGIPLRLFCTHAALARWFAHLLDGADFASIPTLLKLALLDQEAGLLPGLTFNAIEPHRSSTYRAYLTVTFSRGDERLNLWLEGNPRSLVRYLPQRPIEDLLPVKLCVSLQTASIQVTQSELRSLEGGDVFLLPPGSDLVNLHGFLEGQPWALFRQHGNQLELLTMHEDAPVEPFNNLSNFDQLPVPVTFEVGRKSLDLQTLATLQPGSLIDLGTPCRVKYAYWPITATSAPVNW